MSENVNLETLASWANDPKGPVALHMKQKLLPVETIEEKEGEVGIIYPPTYADIGYNIDPYETDEHGREKKVALIDSLGSQGNRLELFFKAPEDADKETWLVPQIHIVLRTEDTWKERVSLLDLAHRSADAVVHSTPELHKLTQPAFEELRKTGNAEPLCTIAPTSLVFGVWDSRGSNEKRPRLVRSLIRAWDIEQLQSAAQYKSIWSKLTEAEQEDLKAEAKKKVKNKQNKKPSKVGLADAPATHYQGTKRRILGGVLVRGRIEREVTVNLVALRGLRGEDDESTVALRKYLLGLSLIAATSDIDLFLREGCNLRDGAEDVWYSIPRRGTPTTVCLATDESLKLIRKFTNDAAKPFREKWPEKVEYEFDMAEAKKLLGAQTDEEKEEGA